MVAGGPDADGMRPTGVEGQHAPQRGDAGVGGIGGEVAAEGAEEGVQATADHAGLNPDPGVVERFEFDEVAGEIEHQPGPEGVAREAGPGSPGEDGEFFLAGVPHDLGEIFVIAGSDDRQRGDLVETAVGRVERDRQRVAADLTPEFGREILPNAGPLFVDYRWHDAIRELPGVNRRGKRERLDQNRAPQWKRSASGKAAWFGWGRADRGRDLNEN